MPHPDRAGQASNDTGCREESPCQEKGIPWTWSTGEVCPLYGTHSTVGQNHTAHADRFVTTQQRQPHQHVWIISQPWHQRHPTARNMINLSFWRDTQLVSQTSSAIFSFFLTECTKTFSIFGSGQKENHSHLFSWLLKEIRNRTRAVHDWVMIKVVILLVELSSKNTLQSGMNMFTFKKGETKIVIKVEGRVQINLRCQW